MQELNINIRKKQFNYQRIFVPHKNQSVKYPSVSKLPFTEKEGCDRARTVIPGLW